MVNSACLVMPGSKELASTSENKKDWYRSKMSKRKKQPTKQQKTRPSYYETVILENRTPYQSVHMRPFCQTNSSLIGSNSHCFTIPKTVWISWWVYTGFVPSPYPINWICWWVFLRADSWCLIMPGPQRCGIGREAGGDLACLTTLCTQSSPRPQPKTIPNTKRQETKC